jgi:outer membrane receptor protein involved in Fe transport
VPPCVRGRHLARDEPKRRHGRGALFGPRIQHAHQHRYEPDTYGGTSTYTVVDAKFSFRPTKRTELGIGVDNLFDHRYYVFHPYAGRTVYVEGRIGI